MFNNYYKNKKVLVTGHTGFKGTWLTLWLSMLGAKVAGYSSYLPSKPCNFEVLNLENKLVHHTGDVRDITQLSKVFKEFKPEVVFHLAAQPIVRRSYDDPKETFDVNIGGTINILECIRQNENIESAVIITSDKCYKNVEWQWGYRENDALGGEDPYSASKGCAEIVINSYCKSFFNDTKTRIASTRAGNVIGGGDWAEDRIVPDCMKAWSQNVTLSIRNPNATRPWQYVLEPLSGYLWLGALLANNDVKSGEAFNFGPKNNVIQPVGVLIDALKNNFQHGEYKHTELANSKKESNLLKLCCDKALAQLDWEAILSFEETIEFTGKWYEKFYSKNETMSDFSKAQIKEYSELAHKRKLEWTKID